jgi:transcription antitermination factor NusG
MNADTRKTEVVVPVPSGVGSGVAVPKTQWYVAKTNRNNVEKATAERLTRQGYECYVATQQMIRIWQNGRRKKVDHVVIPSTVFIRCTEEQRLQAAYDPNISRFLTDRASQSESGNSKRIATIPDAQMERMKFMLGQSDIPVGFTPVRYHNGDKVRVIRGNLAGLEGLVIKATDNKSELVVSVDLLGSAKLTVNTTDLEKTK